MLGLRLCRKNSEIIIYMYPCILYYTVGNTVYVMFGRSFQGHTGGVEHVSFDGNAIISASTDL